MAGTSDANVLTREYYDSILIKTRYIDSDLGNTGIELFGKHFDTPICTAALSHLNGTHERGMVCLAEGAKNAGAVNFCGMESYEGEIDDIMTAGASTIRIIKPHAEDADVLSRIEHAKELGVFAMGMDIDHAYRNNGGYDDVYGLKMKPKSKTQLAEYVRAAEGTPFIVKGILSIEDAAKCAEIGAAGIVVSHHHGIMPYSVPPVMVLPDIAKEVGGSLKIFVDCGIESGMDVYKALALGADAVCVGRALMGPLKENGAEGVTRKIGEMTAELSVIMGRTGFARVSDIDASALCRMRTVYE